MYIYIYIYPPTHSADQFCSHFVEKIKTIH